MRRGKRAAERGGEGRGGGGGGGGARLLQGSCRHYAEARCGHIWPQISGTSDSANCLTDYATTSEVTFGLASLTSGNKVTVLLAASWRTASCRPEIKQQNYDLGTV